MSTTRDSHSVSRRAFLGAAAALSVAPAPASRQTSGKPALLGGDPIRKTPFPDWPVIKKNDETAWLEVLQSKKWNRRNGRHVGDFEQAWATKLGAKHALATNGGTTALWTALNALGVGPKDEVIVPPYTFIATINVVLLQYALPVFVDTDRETFQIDAAKIEAAITPRTRCILPVHLGGASAEMDQILAVAKKHNIPVVEDACQSHLAEWRGKKVGALADIGCFSFQASKNLNCGEGGILVTDSDDLLGRAEFFHNNGSSIGKSPLEQIQRSNGCNLRMTEFQGALLGSQLERLDEQAARREKNAEYLSSKLDAIAGITPARMYEGCTRNAYHLYMFRYDSSAFDGLPRGKFIEAMKAEGVGVSSGYRPLNQDEFLENTFASRAFRAIYSDQELASWREKNHCPENERLCEEALWLSQSTLLAGEADMDDIAAAVVKIQKHAAELAKA